MNEKRYHTIVVGAGMAGLTAAAYLSRAGKHVLLIEKNKECGGLVNTFSHNGFRFDAGVRALLNAGIIFPMLDQLGISMDVHKSPVSIGLGQDIIHVEDVHSLSDYSNMLKKAYPGTQDEIEQLMRIIRKVMKDMDVLYGIENPNFMDMKRNREFLLKKLLPWLPRFLFTIGRINRMNKPVEPFLEPIIRHRPLLDIITQHFFKNTPAFFALSYFSLYLDYIYPSGGTGTLPEIMENYVAEQGVEIQLHTMISQVRAGEKVLVDSERETYRYENLVWTADLKTLYRITDTTGISKKAGKRIEKMNRRFKGKRGGDSVYTLYLEVDEPPETFRKIANGHFFYTPSKQGLGETHWSKLDDLIKTGAASHKKQVLEWLDDFLSLNTFEISIPVLKDPTMAPEGKTGLIVSILAEYELFKKIETAGWLKEFVEGMEDRIIAVLNNSVYPMLKANLTNRFSFTPLSYERRVGSSDGAITGWSFREPVPVIHKMQQANRAVNTAIPSVFQAGQWTYSPGGVPMSILTGKLAAGKVLSRSARKT